MIYIGVDPGQTGGLVAIHPDMIVMDAMPPTERDIWDWFRAYTVFQYVCDECHYVRDRREVETMATIERVHSFPGQGVASTFKFGAGYGGLRMALTAGSIPFEDITPRTWQKAFNIPVKKKGETKDQFKQRLRAKAQQLFPSEASQITLKTADALLIAEYGRRKNEGIL